MVHKPVNSVCYRQRSAAADPKRLALYNFDGNLGDFYTKIWINPFAEKHDVKIDIIRLKGSRAPLGFPPDAVYLLRDEG